MESVGDCFIFIGKVNMISFGTYRRVKLLEYAMKVVERMLERWVRTVISLKRIHFGFIPERKQWIQFLLRGECKWGIKMRKRSCISVLLT